MSRAERDEAADGRASDAGARRLRHLVLIIAIVGGVIALVTWTLLSLQPLPP